MRRAPLHKNTVDIEGLNDIYNSLGLIQDALDKHIYLLRGACDCGPQLLSSVAQLYRARDTISRVIVSHYKE